MVAVSFPVKQTTQSRLNQVDFSALGFGNHLSDHMFMADYKNGEWSNAQIMPYGELLLSPSMLALHYGQAVFEGMKAFKMKDGKASVFRLKRHHQRLNKTLHRMCMPAVPEELFEQGIATLVELDKNWIPTCEGCSLYIRPFVFASEAKLGVKVSDEYKFMILTSPVGAYFSKPVRLKVETKFVRAAEGGTGYAKCAGNYGGAFYPTQLAKEEGFDQVIWTDARHHEFIDESGAMNIMFVLNNELVTPELTTTILDGVTRNSILTLAKDMGLNTAERRVSIKELIQAFDKNQVQEIFVVGTAAVVSTVGAVNIEGKEFTVPVATPSSFHLRVKEKLHRIRTGVDADIHHWNYIV